MIGLVLVTGLTGCSVSASGGSGGGSVSIGEDRNEENMQASLDRSVPPAVGRPPDMNLPERHIFALSNGLPVHVVQDDGLPIVSVEIHIEGGGRVGTPGLGALLADMLDEGTTTRSAAELAAEIERLGASLSTTAGSDGSVIHLVALSPRLDRALALLSDVVLNPAFDEAELDRVKRQSITRILQSRDEASELADNAFADRLYEAGSPYGQPSWVLRRRCERSADPTWTPSTGRRFGRGTCPSWWSGTWTGTSWRRSWRQRWVPCPRGRAWNSSASPRG